jgi:hypothetical protein
MRDQNLKQGEVITIEFDRPTAFLGIELARTGLDNGIPALALLGPRKDLDDDFSASAYILDFLISSASGVTATAVTALVSKLLSDRGKRDGVTIIVTRLPGTPEDRSLRIGVTHAEQQPEEP